MVGGAFLFVSSPQTSQRRENNLEQHLRQLITVMTAFPGSFPRSRSEKAITRTGSSEIHSVARIIKEEKARNGLEIYVISR